MDFVIADTGVLSFLIRDYARRPAYQSFLGRRTLAISFQTVAEVLAAQLGPARRVSLEAALRWSAVLPHAHETSECYALVSNARQQLRRGRQVGSDAGDADMWIIASALQYALPLMSHDRQQVMLGRAMGVRVFTTLPELAHGNPP